jgi:gliding motility-associated-like protein
MARKALLKSLRNRIVFSILLLYCQISGGQNLVENYSFEETPASCQAGSTWAYVFAFGSVYGIPNWVIHPYVGVYHPCLPWVQANPNPYPIPKDGFALTSILTRFNSNYSATCGGYQFGFLHYPINSKLLAGHTYCVEAWVRTHDSSSYHVRNLGFYFKDTILTGCENKGGGAVNPQVQWNWGQWFTEKNAWVRVHGSFVATGTEDHFFFANWPQDTNDYLPVLPFPNPVSFWGPYGMLLVDAVSLYDCTDTNLVANLGPDTVLCPGESVVLQPALTGFMLEDTTTTYLWSTGSTDSTIQVSQSGTYWVQVTINNRFVASDTTIVTAIAAYPTTLVDSTRWCEGQDLVLTVPFHPQATWLWNNGYTSNSIAVYSEGLYEVETTTPCETILEETWVYRVNCRTSLFLPTAFTPNGDGINDFYTPLGTEEPYTLEVYDRWGTQVFRMDRYDGGWGGTGLDGGPLPEGVYTLRIRFENAQLPDQTAFVVLLK